MSDFHKNTQNIEDALERMTSMEPYHCNPFNNPPQLKKKSGYLLKELATLTELDGDRRAEILKELFGTYHHLAFPGDGFHCDYPAGAIAADVPCKIIRKITDDDIFEDMN